MKKVIKAEVVKDQKTLEEAARKKDTIVVLSQTLLGKKTYLKGFSEVKGTHCTTEKREQALKVSADKAEKLVQDANGGRLYKLAHAEKA